MSTPVEQSGCGPEPCLAAITALKGGADRSLKDSRRGETACCGSRRSSASAVLPSVLSPVPEHLSLQFVQTPSQFRFVLGRRGRAEFVQEPQLRSRYRAGLDRPPRDGAPGIEPGPVRFCCKLLQ